MTRRPSHAEILEQVIACGLSAANVELFVDDEGIDNAHISPAGEPESTYEAGVFCLMKWAASSGAAMGFDVHTIRKQ